MTNLLRDEDGPPCIQPPDPPSAPRVIDVSQLPGYVVVPIPDVNARPEHVSSVLRRVMSELQTLTDELARDVPGETREHLNAAWKELRATVVSLPSGRVSER